MGYGALDTDWLTHHSPDQSKAAGCCYDTQASGQPLFALAQHDKGRIVGFEIFPEPPVTLAKAKALTLALLPPDAAPVSDTSGTQCENVWYRSDAIAAIFGYGYFTVSYSSPPVGGVVQPLDSARISDVVFSQPVYDKPEAIPC
jgi:hypothetical protein